MNQPACLQDTASKKKVALAAVYQQIGEMLAQDERVAQHEVDCELEASQTKLRDLTTKFIDNSERMKKAREKIDTLLSQAGTPAFLQVGLKHASSFSSSTKGAFPLASRTLTG